MMDHEAVPEPKNDSTTLKTATYDEVEAIDIIHTTKIFLYKKMSYWSK